MAQRADQQLVVVTGGAGFIGSHTVDRLLQGGCGVVVIDDFSTGRWENLARWRGDERLTVVEADVSDGLFAPLASVTAERGPVDRIVHLAAQTSVVFSVDNPLQDVRVNYTGTVQVLEYARRARVKKVSFSSSAAIYGDAAPCPVREDGPMLPLSPYGIDKYASELALRYYSSVFGIDTAVFRFFNVYGPRQDPSSPYSGVISIFVDRALAGEELTIFGDGEQTRDFVYVGDVSRLVAEVTLADGDDGRAVNVGTGKETTVNALAEAVNRECGGRSSIAHGPPRNGEILRSVADVSRARGLYDFAATVALDGGLADTIAAIRRG